MSGSGLVEQVTGPIAIGSDRRLIDRLVRMDRNTGRLRVETCVAGTELTVRGGDGGVLVKAPLPLAPHELPAGRYALEVRMPDRHVQYTPVSVTRGTTGLVSVDPPQVRTLWTRAAQLYGSSADFDADSDGAPDLITLESERRHVVSAKTGRTLATSPEPPSQLLGGRSVSWAELTRTDRVVSVQPARLERAGPHRAVLTLQSGSVLAVDVDSAKVTYFIAGENRGPHVAPVLADVDADGGTDVVTVAGTQVVARVGADMRVLWSVPAPAQTAALILVDGLLSGRPLAVMSTRAGLVTAADPRSGAVSWSWRAPWTGPGHGDATIVAGDLDGDARPDVVVSMRCRVVALSGEVKPLWEIAGTGPTDLAIGRLTPDRRPVMVVGGVSSLAAYDGASGRPVWALRDVLAFHEVSLADLDGDGLDDVVAKRGSHCLETYRGADFDGDGSLDVACVGPAGGAYVLEGRTARTLWRSSFQQRLASRGTLADVDADGTPDVLLVGEQGLVAALSGRNGAPLALDLSGRNAVAPIPVSSADGKSVRDESSARIVRKTTRPGDVARLLVLGADDVLRMLAAPRPVR